MALLLALPEKVFGGIAPDIYEPDNTSGTASFVGVNSFNQTHNFDSESDEDWAYFHVYAGQQFEVTTLNLGTQSDTLLELFDDSDLINPIIFNDDDGPEPRASFISETASEDSLYYVRVTFVAGIVSFGPDSGYDLQVTTGEAGCNNCGFNFYGVVSASGGMNLTSASVALILDEAPAPTPITSTSSDGSGAYLVCGLSHQNGQTKTYVVTISKPGFATEVRIVDVTTCTSYVNNVGLHQGTLSVAEVDFARGQYEAQNGTASTPYRTLAQGIAAVTPGLTVNLQPGSTSETFSGGSVISKAMTLQRDPGETGSVIIGSSGARSAAPAASTYSQQGFVSRSATH